MSMYEDECVICKQTTLGVTGWDDVIIGRQLVLAPWEGEGETIEGNLHFACVQSWSHKDAFFNELAAAYTGAPDATITLRDRHSGELTSVPRPTSESYEPVCTGPGLLILAQPEEKRWTAIDADWGWIRLDHREAARIAADDRSPVEGGFARLSLDRDLPLEATEWSVGELLDHLDLEPRYPGLRTTPGVSMELYFKAPEKSRHAVRLALDVPLLVPDRVRAYFMQLLADEGPDAFKLVLPD
ncbi:hypothetical protein [Catenulispora subtropica]|uniref:Uncharacterized protein n=1 Tax=Catenulispora subtropica TaxID=450798 RepID=A0ABN2R1I7_9ACTN